MGGTVRNAATRKVLRGVKITIVGGKARTTSKTGKYSAVRALWPVTNYRIKFSKKGFFSVTKRFFSAPVRASS